MMKSVSKDAWSKQSNCMRFIVVATDEDLACDGSPAIYTSPAQRLPPAQSLRRATVPSAQIVGEAKEGTATSNEGWEEKAKRVKDPVFSDRSER
ncbi:hypothetical protein GUJ93_ZPchr0007g3793 [Zizania palustris]|uniref:Uncharacterized protein n=1 Tax=Zizania palustris TaxID=103762 RepID=A0A8J5W419_ZIZPA|nr:hypothetical protein GUJ93_ZPchr0007g3793 [Zizania palustris]